MGLQTLIGKNVDIAFKVLGYPDQKHIFNNTVVYTWNKSQSSVRTYSTPQVTSGIIGDKSFKATIIENQYIPVNESCKIQLAVDSHGYIKSFDYDDEGGCYSYSLRLEKYRSRQVAPS